MSFPRARDKARRLAARDIEQLARLVKRYRYKSKAAELIGIHPSTLERYLSGVCHPINASALEGLRAAIGRALGQ